MPTAEDTAMQLPIVAVVSARTTGLLILHGLKMRVQIYFSSDDYPS
jgi:hypothetical protein